jgi:A/G-specific adenine glycosylase
MKLPAENSSATPVCKQVLELMTFASVPFRFALQMKPNSSIQKQLARQLVLWYERVRRELPWRMTKEPYPIWISEVMLQQTTVATVISYYELFMKRFPSLTTLATAPLEDVLEHWAGLGYYSRARNLHRAAQVLASNPHGFPRTHAKLKELPGFGPYTARAVASLAFGERTGVLDGNVIRVLSRLYSLQTEWWKPQNRQVLQHLADAMTEVEDSSVVNQGLMELGATICTPAAPSCLICPWTSKCEARKHQLVASLPLKKPRRAREIWQWSPEIHTRRGQVLLVKNDYAPFLKGHMILPGSVRRLAKAPKHFDYRGVVTHHDIFVILKTPKKSATPRAEKWVTIGQEMKKHIPAALIRKAIEKELCQKE